MRQLAWLHAVPKPAEGTKRAAAGRQDDAPSRLARLKKDKLPIPLPPNPMPHIIGRLMEIGLSEPAGMGIGPLSWITIDAWQRLAAVRLAPWEAKLIRSLSAAYVAESRAAEWETAPPPWRTEVTQRERDVADAQLLAVLG